MSEDHGTQFDSILGKLKMYRLRERSMRLLYSIPYVACSGGYGGLASRALQLCCFLQVFNFRLDRDFSEFSRAYFDEGFPDLFNLQLYFGPCSGQEDENCQSPAGNVL